LSSRRAPAARPGFTLIELVVAMAITAIIIYVAFGTLTYGIATARRAQNRSEIQEDLSAVIDQATKELRETSTQNDGVGGAGCFGVTIPQAVTGTTDSVRHLVDVLSGLSPHPPLSGTQQYVFDAAKSLLEFYTYGVDPTDPTPATPSKPLVKHRIRYGLSIPSTGALTRNFWPLAQYQPVQVTYANDTYDTATGSWTTVTPQPVTAQAVTDFIVIRPAGSRGAIQLVIEANVRNASGLGASPIRMLAQVTLRQ
jgi:prepilin-type N-terminal cleavage/methylation domain-containing protein